MVECDIGGHFRKDEDKDFPWNFRDGSVWYFIIKPNCELDGYTSSKTNKQYLIERLKALLKDGVKFELLGVWTGKYRTDLFFLNPREAIGRLERNL